MIASTLLFSTTNFLLAVFLSTHVANSFAIRAWPVGTATELTAQVLSSMISMGLRLLRQILSFADLKTRCVRCVPFDSLSINHAKRPRRVVFPIALADAISGYSNWEVVFASISFERDKYLC